jgi:N-acetylglucosamine kinase-like BadF-type ATPase
VRDLGHLASGALGSARGSDALVAGVDGGGTGSRALILDLDGEEAGSAEGPPALVDPSNPGAAAHAIRATVREAMEKAGSASPLKALWAGLAGAGRAGAREAVEIALRSLALAQRVKVGMDVEGAHRDAFGTGPGVLLVVGTGSMAWGRDPEGREIRVGGWGGILGDEGSGYWLGLQGLRAVARASDGRGPFTTLTRTLLRKLRLADPQALISWTASAGKREIAALAPLVLEAAVAGDEGGAEILEGGLKELRRHLEVVRSRWPSEEGPVPLALVGGLTEEGGPLRGRLAPLVEEVGGRLAHSPVVPVRGAALLALELARAG